MNSFTKESIRFFALSTISASLRKQSLRCPRGVERVAAIAETFVQTERTRAPEFDLQRLYAEARPVRRTRHARERVFRGKARDFLLQRKASFHRSRLTRGPGADLAVFRP